MRLLQQEVFVVKYTWTTQKMCCFLGPANYTFELGQMTNWTKWESVHFNSGQLLFNDVNWELEHHIIGEKNGEEG